jgi:arginine decarboxylase
METVIVAGDVGRGFAEQQRAPVIRLSSGTGEGPTPSAAFDAALLDAGVAEYGRRQCVVMAQMRQSRPGRQAHAGIGWVQEDAQERGLFVELHDDDRDRLEHDLYAALASMRRGTGGCFGRVQTAIASRQCAASPVCALVVAVYASEPR